MTTHNQNSSSRIHNINAETWSRAKQHPWIWMLIAVLSVAWVFFLYQQEWPPDDMVEAIGSMFFFPLILSITFLAFIGRKVKGEFWRQFSVRNGFSYASTHDISAERGVMFKEGRNHSAEHLIQGIFQGVPMKIFNYEFDNPAGKHSKHHFYVVFEFTFKGEFPHLYLDRLRDGYGMKVGEKIPLSAEFEKKFRLYAPREYEIEALQVFTPDILFTLLEDNFRHDIEIVDGELLIFIRRGINSINELEREFKNAFRIYELFVPTLNRMRFSLIGDHTPRLHPPIGRSILSK